MESFSHQKKALKFGQDREYAAYFLDPGTGKTRVALLDGKHNFDLGKIEAMLVIAPNSVKTSWVAWPHMLDKGEEDQVATHIGNDVVKGVWVSGATGKDRQAWEEFEQSVDKTNQLIILSMNYEALLNGKLFGFLEDFTTQFKTMIVADESTYIGKPGSKRTKAAIKLRKNCVMARALSGTPIIKSPLKIYSQARFLSETALGFTSFYSFRNRYCVMGGYLNKQVLKYRREDELSDKIASFSFRVRKEDCLDLPPQIYHKRRVYMTKKQEKAYGTMRKEFYANVDGQEITANIVLTQMMRLQQICGGYMTDGKRVIEIIPPAQNPKLLGALDIIQSAPRQVVAWFRFREELDGMAKLLQDKMKDIRIAEFHGGVPQNNRVKIRKDFKNGKYDVILGTAASGGIGIDEFKVADTVIFEKRKQAEDRNHRIGSEVHDSVNYYDLMVPNTVETKIIRTLRDNAMVSGSILRESWREWI